jgi:lauroyl/myristoyl acyltransferase
MLSPIVISIGKIVFRATSIVLDSFPESLKGFIAEISALMFFIGSPASRRNVRENLSVVDVNSTNGVIFNVFRNHTRNIVEMFTSSRWETPEIQKRIDFVGREVLDSALSERRGVILATVHVGNWELAALYLSSLGYKLHVVAGIQMNRFLTEAVKETKERMGIDVINPQHSYRKLFKALQSNSIVALLLDGDVFSGGVEINIFGARTVVPKGAVQLSRKTGAPIIGGYCKRIGGGRFRIYIESIVGAREAASLTEDESLRRIYSKLEDFIRNNSEQWCIFRKLWRNVH